MKVSQIVLELMVSDVDETVRFYKKTLGFLLVANEKENGKAYWAKVQKGDFVLTFKEEVRLKKEVDYLKNHDISASTAICLIVDDLEGFYEIVKRQCDLLDHPHITPCGSSQFSMLDNNGYVLTIERLAS